MQQIIKDSRKFMAPNYKYLRQCMNVKTDRRGRMRGRQKHKRLEICLEKQQENKKEEEKKDQVQENKNMLVLK